MAEADDNTAGTKTPTPPRQSPAREARLAAALRENLRRRKAQARDRRHATDGAKSPKD